VRVHQQRRRHVRLGLAAGGASDSRSVGVF
jgi:hypothetical protein